MRDNSYSIHSRTTLLDVISKPRLNWCLGKSKYLCHWAGSTNKEWAWGAHKIHLWRQGITETYTLSLPQPHFLMFPSPPRIQPPARSKWSAHVEDSSHSCPRVLGAVANLQVQPWGQGWLHSTPQSPLPCKKHFYTPGWMGLHIRHANQMLINHT